MQPEDQWPLHLQLRCLALGSNYMCPLREPPAHQEASGSTLSSILPSCMYACYANGSQKHCIEHC